jgi:hypothetical protein
MHAMHILHSRIRGKVGVSAGGISSCGGSRRSRVFLGMHEWAGRSGGRLGRLILLVGYQCGCVAQVVGGLEVRKEGSMRKK